MEQRNCSIIHIYTKCEKTGLTIMLSYKVEWSSSNPNFLRVVTNSGEAIDFSMILTGSLLVTNGLSKSPLSDTLKPTNVAVALSLLKKM